MPLLKLGHHRRIQHAKQNCKIREQLRKHQHYRDLNLEPCQPGNSKTVSQGGRAIRRSAAVSTTSHSHLQSELHAPNFRRFRACHAAATGFQHNRTAEFPDLGRGVFTQFEDLVSNSPTPQGRSLFRHRLQAGQSLFKITADHFVAVGEQAKRLEKEVIFPGHAPRDGGLIASGTEREIRRVGGFHRS